MKIAHLTTVDLSLRYLVLPQLEAVLDWAESIGISAPGEYVPELEQKGIRHIALHSSTRGMSLWSDVKAMRELWRILKTEAPDILHTHNPKPGVYGRILGRLAGVPVVVNTVHGLYATRDDHLLKRVIVYALEAVASRFSDMELVQNPEDLELLRRLRIVSSAKLRLLGNGVDLSRFNPVRAESLREVARSELGLAAGDVAVGMVGRLVAEKGVPELIEAVELLDPGIRVFVVGPHDRDKPDAIGDELLERGRRAGIEFLGMRTNVDSLYAAFDLFVLPSHREGFPRAAIEAAASGLPLILTDIRGCRQVVEDGVNGVLVPLRDSRRLAAAIGSLANEQDWRQEMGRASSERAARHFDENRVVQIVVDTYQGLLQENGLAWKKTFQVDQPSLRPARLSDVNSIARLHSDLINTGFLASLGSGFLRILYRAMIESEMASVSVADADGTVIGFIAGTEDTRAFYREFLKRKFLFAGLHLIPALLRPSLWRRVWETARYGAGAGSSPDSELLSMAVAPNSQGLGLGSRLVTSLQEWFKSRDVNVAKVVVGASNESAIALYSRCGFGLSRRVEIHVGTESLEMTWRP